MRFFRKRPAAPCGSCGRLRSALAIALAAALLPACSGGDGGSYNRKLGVSASPRLADPNAPVPKGGGHYKVGNPYQVAGQWYYPQHEPGYDEVGIASWYGIDFHGRQTSNGEIFDMNALTAAHKTLPMPSYAYVTNLENGRTILVRVNDRGPYVGNRMIDLSRASAQALGFAGQGLKQVRVRYAGHAPIDGSDMREQKYLAGQPWWGGRAQFARQPYAIPQEAAHGQLPRHMTPRPMPPSRPAREERYGWTAFGYRSGLVSTR